MHVSILGIIDLVGLSLASHPFGGRHAWSDMADLGAVGKSAISGMCSDMVLCNDQCLRLQVLIECVNNITQVMKGVSAHLLATLKCLTACSLCSKRRNVPARTTPVHSTGPHNSETLAPAFALMLLTIVGSICGFGALLRGNAEYLTTFWQFIFAFGVFSLLFPLVEDVRHGKAKLSTMVILWAIVLSSAIAFSWTNVNPFANHNHGPSLRDCGIRC